MLGTHNVCHLLLTGPTMGKRETDMTEFLPLVPNLLEHIQRQAGLRLADIHRKLADQMKMRDQAIKRNWLRWRSVTDQVDGRGRLAQSRSLSRLVRAADQLGWLKDADVCAPLLEYLRGFEARHQRELIDSARRGMDAMRHQVREVIRQRETTAYDDMTWLSALYELVAMEVASELRRRLLGTADPEHPPPELGNDLLAGSLSRLVESVFEAGSRPMLALQKVVVAMEKRVRAEFDVAQSSGEGFE
jgi:hypothetical protein